VVACQFPELLVCQCKGVPGTTNRERRQPEFRPHYFREMTSARPSASMKCKCRLFPGKIRQLRRYSRHNKGACCGTLFYKVEYVHHVRILLLPDPIVALQCIRLVNMAYQFTIDGKPRATNVERRAR